MKFTKRKPPKTKPVQDDDPIDESTMAFETCEIFLELFKKLEEEEKRSGQKPS